jgi:AraC-like DNA-binding protein
MRPSDLVAFHAHPAGRYVAGRTWMAWCWDRTLVGSVQWGRPSEEDVRDLLACYDILDSLADKFDVVTDSSRMVGVSVAGFAAVTSYVARHLTKLITRIRRQAIVIPPGIIGAAVAGMYPLLGSAPRWQAFTSFPMAFEWLDTDVARAAAPEITRVIHETVRRPTIVVALHEYLATRLVHATLEGAARTFGMATRSLQRDLARANTSFRAELETVRVEAACRRIAETEDKLEAIAADLGYSSASHFGARFRAVMGLTPTAFRARHRGDLARG